VPESATFVLTPDDHAAAAEAFVRGRMGEIDADLSRGPLAAIDRVVDALQLWFLRGCLLLAALAGCTVLLFVQPTLGIAALLLMPFAIVLYAKGERAVRKGAARIERSIDDGIVAWSAGDLRRALEAGRHRALLGETVATLDEHAETLELQATGHAVRIELAPGVIRARSARHLMLAAAPPRRPSDLADIALVPLDTDLGRRLEARFSTAPTR